MQAHIKNLLKWVKHNSARQNDGRIAELGGHSVVHFSGLYRLARALATGEATVILQAFQHNSFVHPNPPANKLRASIKNPLKWVENCLPPKP